MKTRSSPVPRPVKQPLLAGPRQLCMTFETPVLLAATPEQRATATQALATVLMQAAGPDDSEADDDVHSDLLPADVLRRKAVVYVRQSTQTPVQVNLESKRRQYDLVQQARRRGFQRVE